MKPLLPHISIGADKAGCVILEIEDYELFDFIDDYLTEKCDFPYESQRSRERLGGEVITMRFPREITKEQVEESLMKLSHQEIEAIYRLNNA